MLQKLNKKHEGFTLVEIMIVVAIIALLAAIAVPNFLRSRKRSQATRILEDLRMIDGAVDQYAIEANKSPGNTVTWTQIKLYLKSGISLTAFHNEIAEAAAKNVLLPCSMGATLARGVAITLSWVAPRPPTALFCAAPSCWPACCCTGTTTRL